MKSFYLAPEQWPDDVDCEVQLDDAESHHLAKVLRIQPGEQVRLFDGQGRDGLFEVVHARKSGAELTPLSVLHHPRPERQLTLALGWAKALRRGWLLEKAVELEAAGVWFFQAERSQGRVPEESKETWHAKLVAAAKQCGNPWLPEVRVIPEGVAELGRAAADFDRKLILWEEQQDVRLLGQKELHSDAALMALGPEGGLTISEVNLLRDQGFSPVSLGSRVLRWETAAMLCLGLFWWAGQPRSPEPEVGA